MGAPARDARAGDLPLSAPSPASRSAAGPLARVCGVHTHDVNKGMLGAGSPLWGADAFHLGHHPELLQQSIDGVACDSNRGKKPLISSHNKLTVQS